MSSSARRDPPRRPKGHQPQYFEDPAIDQLHSALLAVTGELAVAFDRIDTLETLLVQRAGITREQIDSFAPDEAAVQRRVARRTDLAERLLKPFKDYRESLFERAARSETVATSDATTWTGAGAGT